MRHDVHDAVVTARLDRADLLAQVPPGVVAATAPGNSRAARLRADLRALCDAGTLDDGTIPLAIWLENAVRLAGLRREGKVFREALASLIDPSSPATPRTILFVGSNPSATSRIDLDKEVRTIDAQLQKGPRAGSLRLEQVWAVRPIDLDDGLRRYLPTVVHFAGHADDQGQFILQDDSGAPLLVSIGALASLFRIRGERVRCVVLNACCTEPTARAITEHIDCAVGMSARPRSDTAIAFAQGFYRSLAAGESVHLAVEGGRAHVAMSGTGEEWMPKLLVRQGVRATDVRL